MIHERIRHNLEKVQARIARAAERAGRPAGDVRLVAVTKKSSPDCGSRPCWIAGYSDLGENYPQELWKKSEVLADRAAAIRWHLIGHLQTNKVKKTLPLVKMIHAVDSLKLLRLLNDAAAAFVNAPQVCLQVNTSGEESKHGWSAEKITQDCRFNRRLPVDSDRGLDDDGGPGARHGGPRSRLLRPVAGNADALSPEDWPAASGAFDGNVRRLEPAILEGATLVRIGSAIFEGYRLDRGGNPRRRSDPAGAGSTRCASGTRSWASGPVPCGVAVTSPPEKGKANEAIGRMLAETLACRMSQIHLISGRRLGRSGFCWKGSVPAS